MTAANAMPIAYGISLIRKTFCTEITSPNMETSQKTKQRTQTPFKTEIPLCLIRQSLRKTLSATAAVMPHIDTAFIIRRNAVHTCVMSL